MQGSDDAVSVCQLRDWHGQTYGKESLMSTGKQKGCNQFARVTAFESGGIGGLEECLEGRTDAEFLSLN